MHPFVLVGGWAGSGNTTLSMALAAELGLACLAKDEGREALMVALGAPGAPMDVPASRDLGAAAGHAVLRLARGCRDARHLDGQRSHDELWGSPIDPLGVGPLVEGDTSRPVDAAALSATIRGLVGL